METNISLELHVNGEYFDTLDSFDATEDYDNAFNQAVEEKNAINNQEWFEDFTEGDFAHEQPYWELKLVGYLIN